MIHYHVEALRIDPKHNINPFITENKSEAEQIYNQIVLSLRNDHGLKTRFYGRNNASFQTGELVIFYSCDKTDCKY